jgi:hypothetical protein
MQTVVSAKIIFDAPTRVRADAGAVVAIGKMRRAAPSLGRPFHRRDRGRFGDEPKGRDLVLKASRRCQARASIIRLQVICDRGWRQ